MATSLSQNGNAVPGPAGSSSDCLCPTSNSGGLHELTAPSETAWHSLGVYGDAAKEPSEAASQSQGCCCSKHHSALVTGTQTRSYSWKGFQLALPSALRLAPWCTLKDDVLEFRGSFEHLHKAAALLEEAGFHIEYDVVDGALWITMPSSLLTDMIPAAVGYQLQLWRKRLQVQQRYELSASSSMVYWTSDPVMLIPDCYIFKHEAFLQLKETARQEQKHIPRDVQAEVVFEFVSAMDNVEATWTKCRRFVTSGRTRMAVGICDREHQKEVFLAYKDGRQNVQTELQQDPRFLDLGRVLPSFRIYFSYLLPTVITHFGAHHAFDLSAMVEQDLQHHMCEQISLAGQGNQAHNELASEIANGLATVNFVDSAGRTPLVVAVSSGNIEMIHFLLANKADPKYPDGDNICALLYAKANDLQVCDVLKARGGDLDVSIGDLCNAMEKGSHLQFEMLLKVLLANGVDIDKSDQVHGYTALSLAVSSGEWIWAISRLIAAGACPTKVDSNGIIPLIKAIGSMSDKEIVDSSILHAQNMDLEVVRSSGIEFAKMLGRSTTLEALKTKLEM